MIQDIVNNKKQKSFLFCDRLIPLDSIESLGSSEEENCFRIEIYFRSGNVLRTAFENKENAKHAFSKITEIFKSKYEIIGIEENN